MVVRAAAPGGTNNVARSARRNRLVCRPRQRAPWIATGWVRAAMSASSRQACRGRLATSRVTDETTADRAIHRARNGATKGEQRARATCRVARRVRRSTSAGRGPPGRSPSRSADASRTTAPGTTMTRWPASWARQPRSRSAPYWSKLRSNPPSSACTARRTSIPLVLTARTSVRPSCWPWSASPRRGSAIRRPVRVIWTPSSTRSRGSCQATILGPAMPTEGDRRTASARRASAVASGAVSSCSTHTHSPTCAVGSAAIPASMATPVGTAWSRPSIVTSGTARRTAWCAVAMATEVSVLATSTMTSRSGGVDWVASASRHSASHVDPLCTTRTALIDETAGVTGPGDRPAEGRPGSPESRASPRRSDSVTMLTQRAF